MLDLLHREALDRLRVRLNMYLVVNVLVRILHDAVTLTKERNLGEDKEMV